MAPVIHKAFMNWRAGLRPLHALNVALMLDTISKLNRRTK
jgi:hypothetical protein